MSKQNARPAPVLALSLFSLFSPLLACTSSTAPSLDLETSGPGPRDIPVDERPAPQEVLSGHLIQRAIDAAGPGETVRLGPGHYRLESELQIRRPLRLEGSPSTVIELGPDVSSSAILVAPAPGESVLAGVHISRLVILGHGSRQGAGAGVTMLDASESSLRDLTIRDCFEDGVYLSGVRDSWFEGLVLVRNGRHGLAFGEARRVPSRGNRIIGCRSSGNALHGFDGEPVAATLFVDCTGADNGGDGFHLGAEARSHGNRISGCAAIHNLGFGIAIWSDSTLVERSTMAANSGAGVHVVGPVARSNVIVECTIRDNGWHGISLDRTTAARVLRNTVVGNALLGSGDGIAAVSSIDVFGNEIIGNTVSGRRHRFALVVTRRVRDVLVRDNLLEGPVSIEGP